MSISSSVNADATNKKWINLNCNTVNANIVRSSTLESDLSLSNSFVYNITTATADPVATNGAQSLYNGILNINVAGPACLITMPSAAVLNTVIPGTPLDNMSFDLTIYNVNPATIISFTSALGVFNYKTNTSAAWSLSPTPFAAGPPNVSQINLKFVRTAVGNFWTVYY